MASPSGLVAWWRGQSGPADSRVKAVGNLKGGVTTTPAKVGRGFLFDGVSGFVDVPDQFNVDQPDFSFPWKFSAEAWIRLDAFAPSLNSSSTIVSQGPDPRDHSSVWRWFVSSTGTLDFEIRDRVGTGAIRYVRTAEPIIQAGTGSFRHVAVTMDLDHQSIRMYLDGTEVATTVMQGSVVPRLIPSAASVRIGGGFESSNFFRGVVDELSLYNTVLTSSQIAAIYAADSAGKCTEPTQLNSPDLSISGFWAYAWQGQPSALQNMTATWRVDNLGQTLGTSGALNRLTLSRDREQREVVQRWEMTSPFEVPSGTFYQVNLPFQIPALPAGEYYLRAESLPYSDPTFDGNLADNAFVLPIYIGVLDLTPTNVVLTTETNAQGLTWNIQWQIKNVGDTPYVRSNFDQIDEWVLSTSPDPVDRIYAWPSFREFETLGPGQTVIMPATRLLPPNVTLGQYYLIIVLKSYLDLNRDNDTVAVPISLPTVESPDLAIRRLGRDGANGSFEAVAGETVAVTWRVENIGRGRAVGTWLDRFSLSKTPANDPASGVAGVALPAVSRSLFPGGSYSDTAYLVIPRSLAPGIYYLVAEVDFPGQMRETDERNNALSIPIRVGAPDLPDVAVSDLGWVGIPSPAQPLEFRFRVTNLGPASANVHSVWYDSIATSAFPDGRNATVLWISPSIRKLPRLASEDVIIKDLKMPVTLAGQYYLVANTRSDDVVEVGGENNTQIVPIFIEKPDLAVSEFAWNGKAEVGQTLSVSWQVQNIGRGAASGYWPDRLVLSYSPSVADAVKSWDFYATNSALPGGSYTLLPRRVQLPTLSPGTYYLIAVADALNLRPELSETNNTQVLPITLGGADLVATELHAGAESVAAGSELAISWNVRTTAPQDYSGFWTDRVLLYATPEKPEPVGSWEFSRHRTISTTTGYSDHETIRLPSVPPGQYSLVLRTDSLDTITESDEANNQVVILLTLTNLPPVVTLRAPINAPSLLSCLPPSVLLSATLELGSYQVQRVDYYDADTLIGTALGDLSGSPVKSSLLAHGQHLLTARATDAWGLTVTSAPVSLSIERPSLNHLLAETALDGSVICCMGAEPGLSYVVESTDGRVSEPVWTARWTNSPTDSLLIFTNRPNRTQQLFRIKIAP